ncbi:MAG: Trm112 family protein [Gammaproteobacteria bacterium]|nr:Trm112 family protein [Gammaproteobacteria bacterium]MCH9744131.1 Trm112 family protein [Gammaproteobacteria bacterium]
MDQRLLEILACPLCKGKLQYDRKKLQLICNFDKLVYPIRENVPIMLPEQAAPLASQN